MPPLPSLANPIELLKTPFVAQEFDELYAQIATYLLTEHHADGTHGDITADSIEVSGDVDIAGDLTVHGAVGFETLSGQFIETVELIVDGPATFQSGPIDVTSVAKFTGAIRTDDGIQSFSTDFLGNPIYKLFDSGGGGALLKMTVLGSGDQTITLSSDGLRLGSSGLGAFVKGWDGTTTHFEIDSTGAAQFDTTTLVVDATNHRVGIGTASPSKPLEVNGAGPELLHLVGTSFAQIGFVSTGHTAFFDLSNSAAALRLGIDGGQVGQWDATRLAVLNTLRMSGSSQRVIEATDGTYRQLKYDAASHLWYESGVLSMTLSGGSLDVHDYKANGVAGFTGSGAFTNFSFSGGICTSAS